MLIQLLLLLGLIYTSSGDGGDCQKPEFRGKCTCGITNYARRPKYVTNCTNAGFTDTEILSEIPQQTEVLIFTGNNIPELEENIFGMSVTFEKLEVIDLSNNHIRIINGQVFHRVPSVSRLILDNNEWFVNTSHPRLFYNMGQLEELYLMNALHLDSDPSSSILFHLGEIFAGSQLESLEYLNLEYNKISLTRNEIKEDMFCKLPKLKRLFLGHNHIVNVNFNFDCLKDLKLLDLSYNHINYVANKTMNQLDNIPGTSVDFLGNQLDCDCNLKDFYRWLLVTKTKVLNRERLQCFDGYPEGNRGSIILARQESDFKCIKLESLPTSSRILYTVLGLVLSLITISLVVFFVLNIHHIRYITDKISQPFTRKMKYSSLDRKCVDEAEAEV